MNPQNSSELPPVYTAMPEQQRMLEQQPGVPSEQVAERVQAQAIEQTPVAQPVAPLSATVAPVATPQAPMATGVSAPAIADDIDLIEKEWVEKAKAIVERTKNDPHQQEREISRYKADYVKKRFNVDLKLEDAA